MIFFLRKISHRLRGQKFFFEQTFNDHTRNFQRTFQIVTLYYMLSVVFGISEMDWGWTSLLNSQLVDVLWPFKPFGSLIKPVLVPFGFLGWIFGAFICVYRQDLRWARILHAAGVFVVVGLRNSDGHFGHSFHAYMWIAMVFAFLPNIRSLHPTISRKKKHHYIQAFWTAQFIICVFYFMTGMWKLRDIAFCAISPDLQCELSASILTNLAAQELVQYRKFAPMSWVLFDYPWLGFVSYLWTLWIHIYSIHFAFRPNLHVFFGSLRIVFHLGTMALFGINFSPFSLAAIFLYALSPFSRLDQSFFTAFKSLPPFDRWSARITSWKNRARPGSALPLNSIHERKIQLFKKSLALVFVVIFSVEAIGWAAYGALNIVYGSNSNITKSSPLQNLPWELKLRPDPVFGFVYGKWWNGRINNFGFSSKHTFPPEKNDQQFVIGIFGSSIGSLLGESMEDLEEENKRALKKALGLPDGRDLVFINFAIDEFRQPQQYSVVSWFLRYVDFAIIIDGANDISGNPFPAFPSGFPKYSLALFDEGQTAHRLRVEFSRLEDRRRNFAWAASDGHVWKYSSVLRLIYQYTVDQQAKLIEAFRSDISLGGKLDLSVYHDKYMNDQKMDSELVDNWTHYTRLTSYILKNAGIPHFQVVEPNYYGSKNKILTSDESARLPQQGFYAETFSRRLDLLRKSASALKKDDVYICDFSTLLDDKTSSVFDGPITSLTDAGLGLLRQAILDTVTRTGKSNRPLCAGKAR